jgi:hypothetical protein
LLAGTWLGFHNGADFRGQPPQAMYRLRSSLAEVGAESCAVYALIEVIRPAKAAALHACDEMAQRGDARALALPQSRVTFSLLSVVASSDAADR